MNDFGIEDNNQLVTQMNQQITSALTTLTLTSQPLHVNYWMIYI